MFSFTANLTMPRYPIMQKGREDSTSNIFGMVKMCVFPLSSCIVQQAVPFHLDIPLALVIPCILMFTLVSAPAKSNLCWTSNKWSLNQWLWGEDTPSGNVLTDEDALVLIIIRRVVRHSANLSLDFCCCIFQATVECLWRVILE
jgi:hypothetical protein